MSALRSFDVLLRSDTGAWLAETVSDEFWYMAQGSSPEMALDRLRFGLHASARLQLNEHRRPLYDPKLPTPREAREIWKRARRLVNVTTCRRDTAYSTIFTDDWGNKAETLRLHQKCGRRS